jgi:uncharacterized protein (TIGR02271 family)
MESTYTHIISKDGVRGTLVEGAPIDAATTHVLIAFETGQRVMVPRDSLTLQADGRYYYLALRLDDLARQQSSSIQAVDEPYVIPVAEEVLEIARRRVETGRVRIDKHVHEQIEVVDEPLLHDEVNVTRVPVNRFLSEPVAPREEGDTLIIPVLREVLVVEKRLLLVEEVHITLQTIETHQSEEVTLRHEEVVIERLHPHHEGRAGGTDVASIGENASAP